MLARQSILVALIACVAGWGWINAGYGQEKGKKENLEKKKIILKKEMKLDDDLEEALLKQVEEALQKFEGELGEKQLSKIMQSIEEQLDGKMKQFQLHMEKLDPSMLHEHKGILDKHNGILKKMEKLELGKMAPQIMQFQAGGKKRVMGVVLEEGEDSRVKIRKVMDGSAAAAAGLQAGDVIVKVNGKKVGDAKSLSKSVQNSKGKIKVSVQRKGKDLVVEVKPKEVAGGDIARAIIELEGVDFDGLEMPKVIFGDGAKFLELHQDGHKDKPGDGKKEKKIIMVHPKDGKKKIEWKIDRAAENQKLLKKKTGDLKNRFEHRIEGESDLSEAIQKLNQQVKELQKELKELRNSKKD